ncbi:MAG: ParB/RepB/Spo0J family partition protein [bacterium]
MAQLYSNSIFWIDVDKIKPNPYQPRREFEEDKLRDLADSIRIYGILQPLVVSRVERDTEDGGMTTEYELIAGERRLRASKLAGVSQVPVVIRIGDDNLMKFELAIIENLQREDLNAVERAKAFKQLSEKFGFTSTQIGQKMGKSREYVANTIRILALPEEILQALSEGKISEGHTRPLLMLKDHPEEQLVLFKEILYKKITVREAERLSRKIATDKVRRNEYKEDPELVSIEKTLQESLGTRVHIERKAVGGQILIDFFSNEDLDSLVGVLKSSEIKHDPNDAINRFMKAFEVKKEHSDQLEVVNEQSGNSKIPEVQNLELGEHAEIVNQIPEIQHLELSGNKEINEFEQQVQMFKDEAEEFKIETEEGLDSLDDSTKEEKQVADTIVDDLYNLKNFSL